MSLSPPTLRVRSNISNGDANYLAKARRVRGSIDSTASTGTNDGSTSSSVLRVSKEVENIGARVPMSKKRVTWRFVLAGSEQVHTVMLEHSRISAKKRLKLDGRHLFTSDQYATNWHYDFQVGEDTLMPFRVVIRDAKSSVVDQGKLETIYDLLADGVHWDQMAERFLPVAFRIHSASVWSSDMYVRRVEDTRGELLSDGGNRPPGTLLTWTFAFGVNGKSIHKLELRDLEEGEFVVVLDCRELKRVSFDDIHANMWEFEYDLEDHHELDLVVTLVDEDKTYDFFIDGSPWSEIGETNFVLESGWYPVYSRSRSAVYFRHDQTGNTQWEKPIVDRKDMLGNRPVQTFEQVSPGSQGLDGLIQSMLAVSVRETILEEPESELENASQSVLTKQPSQPVQEEEVGGQEINLMDFNDDLQQEVQKCDDKEFDPFNPATTASFARKEKLTQQTPPPVDLLSM
ncbi:putative WW domain-containing protein [Plasmopara halstedii]